MKLTILLILAACMFPALLGLATETPVRPTITRPGAQTGTSRPVDSGPTQADLNAMMAAEVIIIRNPNATAGNGRDGRDQPSALILGPGGRAWICDDPGQKPTASQAPNRIGTTSITPGRLNGRNMQGATSNLLGNPSRQTSAVAYSAGNGQTGARTSSQAEAGNWLRGAWERFIALNDSQAVSSWQDARAIRAGVRSMGTQRAEARRGWGMPPPVGQVGPMRGGYRYAGSDIPTLSLPIGLPSLNIVHVPGFTNTSDPQIDWRVIGAPAPGLGSGNLVPASRQPGWKP